MQCVVSEHVKIMMICVTRLISLNPAVMKSRSEKCVQGIVEFAVQTGQIIVTNLIFDEKNSTVQHYKVKQIVQNFAETAQVIIKDNIKRIKYNLYYALSHLRTVSCRKMRRNSMLHVTT